ncbi:MAG: aldehyde dehydrogenase [Calditrichaeota bacterium]|nr:MAG: aldehyde dehydrogenase [Calditrichota bacterium]
MGLNEQVAKSYLNGGWQAPDGAEVREIPNPANVNEVVGRVVFADAALAEIAVQAARKACMAWRFTPSEKRRERLERLLQQIRLHRETFARIITRENGKTLSESLGEVEASLKEAHFQLAYVADHLIEPHGSHRVQHEPLGVAALFTPWNFPLATVLRKMVPALMAGNTVVLKPSEFTSLTAAMLVGLMEELEFPPGVVNLVLGEGPEVGPPIAQHPAVGAISFTGSTRIGLELASSLGARDVRFQGEMGGSNALIILEDADLEAAVDAAVSNGFACCGQWCTGTGRVIVQRQVYHPVLEMLVGRVRRIVVGNGMDAGVIMGPLISQHRREKVEQAVNRAVQEGARVLVGGKRPQGSQYDRGYFYEPTILADVTARMHASREEIFGPVLVVMPADTPDEILQLTNSSPYGLSVSIYTRDKARAEGLVHRIEAGLCHLNLPTGYRDPALPLSGWKDSGRGWPEAGRYGLEFFTRPKAVYVHD